MSLQWLAALSASIFAGDLKMISRYCVLWVGSRYNGLELSFASLENNSELSIQGQALELILVCGWGQQLWLHQGPIRGCVSPARPTPAGGLCVSTPAGDRRRRREAGGQRGKGWRVTLPLCKLETCWKMQLYCNRAGKKSSDRRCWRRRLGRKMSSSYRWCWPQFSKASPSRDLPSLPIIFLLMLPFKRPHMMDDFWWALLYLVGLWLTSFLSTALDVTVLMWLHWLQIWRVSYAVALGG